MESTTVGKVKLNVVKSVAGWWLEWNGDSCSKGGLVGWREVNCCESK